MTRHVDSATLLPPRESDLELDLLFQLKAVGLPAPMRQVQCIPGRRFRFDFAYSGKGLAIEVNGGTWARQGHSTGRGIARDYEKLNLATLAGWRVLLFTGDSVRDGSALKMIEKALAKEASK